MNKERLTLLIALSIIFVLVIILLCLFIKSEENAAAGLESEIPAPVTTEATTATTTTTTIPTTTTTTRPEKYPEAREIWDTMISWGWSAETCAGIIGNMMAEVGGGTLDLSRWDSNGGCGYGLIQWTDERRSLIKNRYGSYPTIQEQLIFMKDEMFGINNTTKQISDEVLNQILNADGNQTPESIAFTFATHFERCAKQYRARRRGYARIAYDYFTNQ